MKKKVQIRLRPKLDRAGENYPPAMRDLLTLGRPEADMSYSDWAEQLHGYVPQLLQMALDPDLNQRQERDRAVWAPLHALNILAVLAPPEAVEPLLEVLAWDDEWVDEPLTAYFAAIGSTAMAALENYVEDRSRDEIGRERAIAALGAIAQQHADLRDRVVGFLIRFMGRSQADTPTDETLTAWVIVELGELEAIDALTPIQSAFDEGKVNTSIIDRESAERMLGAAPEADAPGINADAFGRRPLVLTLKCQACGRERQYSFEKAYFDLGATSAQAGSHADRLIIPERVVCPKCGAVDRYELSGFGYLAVTAKLFALRSGQPDPMPRLELINFTTERWGPIPPREALARYASEVAAHPSDVGLRIGYGNSLRIMGYLEGAADQYDQALMLDPRCGEALINLAQMKSLSDAIVEAIGAWTNIERDFDQLSFPPEDREMRRQEVKHTLADLRAGIRPEYHREQIQLIQPGAPVAPADSQILPPVPTPQGFQDHYQAAPVRPAQGEYGKVGRNDPCPCGSGKKYKQCHGRK